VEFRLLGPLEVRVHGDVLPIHSPRQRSLLAALLLRANQVVTVGRLVDALWGADPPTSAVANVRTHVARLRHRLHEAGDDSRIVTRSAGYLITVAPDELDLALFDDLTARAGCAARQGHHAMAAWTLSRALTLWRGRPMENVPPHGTLEADAARLDEIRLTVVQDCLDATLAAGDHERATVALRALVVTHPLRERLWAQLMMALHRAGRRADALAAYEQARVRLADELGLDPGTELRQLRQRILIGDPTLARPLATAP
jgi:DNA-binding SARP family transcriptional activator